MRDTIALMWDCDGLEAAVNVTSIDQQRMWAVLKGEDASKVPAPPNLMMWKLRAQANMQRHYEIYLISVEEGITADDVVAAFETNPQGMADTVREIGHCFYSNRVREKARIV